MRIEHVAFQVEHPIDAADWYATHLGFTIRRRVAAPVPTRFLADGGGRVMIEFYNNPALTTPDYAALDPLLVHLAFVSGGVDHDVERLQAAGAALVSGPVVLPDGDSLAMLRDPWGLAIQLCHRATAMV